MTPEKRSIFRGSKKGSKMAFFGGLKNTLALCCIKNLLCMKKFYYANTASATCVIEDIKKRSFLRGLKKGLKKGVFGGS